MTQLTIAARDVHVGDYLYNSCAAKAKLPHVFHWNRVTKVELRPDRDWQAGIKHPEEGIAIQRET